MAKNFKHGNSFLNDEPHHLYAVYDKVTDALFKYGISYGRFGVDGLSKRMREQINWLNLAVGWNRYFAVILLKNISGRKEARRIEDEYIEAYEKEYGTRPRGNPKRS